MTYKKNKKPSFKQYCQDLSALIAAIEVSGPQRETISINSASETIKSLITDCGQRDGKALIIGNGGSAAIAAHIQNDLSNGAGVRSLSCQDIPTLTALSNDHGYDQAYVRVVRQWAEPEDLLIAISSSGQSENILRAARAASETGCRVITMSGFKADNPLRQLGEINFYVPVEDYGYVETIHAVIGHFLTDAAQT